MDLDKAILTSGWSELQNTARQVILAAKLYTKSWNYDPIAKDGTYTLSYEQAAEQAQQQLGTSLASTELVALLLNADMEGALIWAAETATGWKVDTHQELAKKVFEKKDQG